MAEQPTSKKWVDYSDSESSEESQAKQYQESPTRPHPKFNTHPQEQALIRYTPSQKQIDQQLDKLDDLDYNRVDEVWIHLFSQNLNYLQNQVKYLSSKAKKGGNIVRLFPTNDPETYEAKVYINTAYDWIEKGYDQHDYIQVTVSERNFHRNNRPRSPRQKDIGRYQDNLNQKQSVGANNREEKKKYVDKQTGKAPQSLRNEQPYPQRMYTREEVEQKAQGLAGFRSKGQVPKREKSESTENKQRKEWVQDELNEEGELKEELVVSKKQEIQEYEKSQLSPRKEREDEPKKQKKKKQGGKGKSGNPFDGMLDL